MTETIKEKLTPKTQPPPPQREDEEETVLVVETTPAGRVVVEETTVARTAATLKAADQVTGQTFNDVGPLGEEGTGRVDRHGKM